MRTKNHLIVIDTETCPIDASINGVDPYNMLTYDIGWAVTDRDGNIVATRSFIVDEIFNGESEKMQSAYYAKKIPQYMESIARGERKVANFYTIRETFKKDVETYKVKKVFAHNMRFDNGTLNTTMRYLTDNKYRYYFPRGLEIHDTLKLSRQLITKMKSYVKFCNNNGYLTKNNQVRATAEVIYRFLTKNTEFTEEHKALDDVLIETEILRYLYAKHKKMNGLLFG